ncbi:MAG: TonB-dependent receptor [Bacteroidales bacterium]|nr:TonB-dependent receptor [Bacteroidales bacterium]
MKKIYSVIVLLYISLSLVAQEFTINGTVRDSQSGAELVGASVSVVGTAIGTFTNGKGQYSLSLPKGSYTIEYSYLGYKDNSFSIQLNDNMRKNVRLVSSAINIDNVVVTSKAQDYNISSTQVGAQTLSMQEIKMVPVLFGENDVLKTLQLMPGVKSAGEGGSGYYVRGGGADQNLILLDDAPVYNASHMMGMFSVFNGDAIKDANLYKGSMSAEYGGRLSSVLDVTMQEGNRETFHGQGGIGTISSRVELEGPIQKDKSSYLIAGRRTYADIFLKLRRDSSLRQTKLHFYDVNYKVSDVINEKNKIELSGYMGRDVFKFRDMFGMDGGNITATLAFTHLSSEKTKLVSSLVFSRFNSKLSMDMAMADMSLVTGITDVNWKGDCEYRMTDNTLHFGGNVTYHTFFPGELKTSMVENPIKLENKKALEANVYIDNSQNIRDVLKLQYGVRFSNFIGLGPSTVYDYNDEHEKIDSVSYKRGECVSYYPNVEPRLSANFRLNETSSVKASYTRTCQFVHLIQSSTVAMPTDYWMPSSNTVKPQTCSQVSVGYFRNFNENMYESSVEVYYKKMNNQIDYENGTNLYLNVDLEAYLLYGHSRSYGLELFVKKELGDLTGWISYSLSKSEKQFQGINSGAWYPVRYDRTHDVSIVLMYDLNEKWKVSATWVYSTGDAVTYPSGKYTIDGETVSYYTERNGYRMPAYHRMDLGATYLTSKTERFESQLAFSIYNVYNRKNAYMIYFEPVDEEHPEVLQAVKITLFPIIPSVSWNFKF